MVTLNPQTQSLAEIYQEHIWIGVDFGNLNLVPSEADLNHICIAEVSKYLTQDLSLVVKSIFPSEGLYFSFVSNLVNGFSLSISGVKIAFIPSQDLDLMSFEIEREWVDLSNWAADYYVPIQVDIESQYLHLWGFISHEYLLDRATLDRNTQSYQVASGDLIDDLDLLWVACDLVASKMLTPERGKIPNLPLLSEPDAKISIDRLQHHQSVFSPRLALTFDRWGAILNRSEYLAMYANSGLIVNKITNWFRSQVGVIEAGWLTVTEIFDRSEPLPGYYAIPKIAAREISPSTQSEISRTVNNIYASQNSAHKVDLPTHIDSPSRLLVHLMQQTTDETLRWKAIEYLWTIEPENSKHWHRRIKDLGLAIQGYKLGLLIAVIPLAAKRYAVLTRVYSIGEEHCLPPNVRLNLLSEDGEQLYQAESRSTVMDDYVQLYFTASIGDRFNICVSMNNASITEAFEI